MKPITDKKSGFYMIDLHNGYLLKYDPFREKNLFTLLLTSGDRIFDGTIEQIINYLHKQQEYKTNNIKETLHES